MERSRGGRRKKKIECSGCNALKKVRGEKWQHMYLVLHITEIVVLAVDDLSAAPAPYLLSDPLSLSLYLGTSASLTWLASKPIVRDVEL